MEQLNENCYQNHDNFVWGPVMLILLVGTGVFLTVRYKISDMEESGICA